MFALPLLLFFLSFLLVLIGPSSPSDGSDGISPLGRELPSPIGVGFFDWTVVFVVLIGDNEHTSFYPQCLLSFPTGFLMLTLVTKFLCVI